jgi:adenylate kinase family enzyme
MAARCLTGSRDRPHGRPRRAAREPLRAVHPPNRPVWQNRRVQRVWVVGNSGSGKSTTGRALAAALGLTYTELDAIFHQPDWGELPTEEFRAAVGALVAGDRWIIDGNYRVVSDLVLERADTVVFLDLPRSVVMRQVVARTLRRVITRAELWNGNREPFSNLWRLDPQKSIIAWAWTQHDKYRDRFGTLMSDPDWAHLSFVRVTSRKAASGLVARVDRVAASGTPSE